MILLLYHSSTYNLMLRCLSALKYSSTNKLRALNYGVSNYRIMGLLLIIYSWFCYVSFLLVLRKVPWDYMTSIKWQQKLRIAVGLPALNSMMTLISWLQFMLIQVMISSWLVVIRENLQYTISALADACSCWQIYIEKQLMLLNLPIALHTFLLLHHMTVMSRCGI